VTAESKEIATNKHLTINLSSRCPVSLSGVALFSYLGCSVFPIGVRLDDDGFWAAQTEHARALRVREIVAAQKRLAPTRKQL
jgi:hypothetical protein